MKVLTFLTNLVMIQNSELVAVDSCRSLVCCRAYETRIKHKYCQKIVYMKEHVCKLD